MHYGGRYEGRNTKVKWLSEDQRCHLPLTIVLLRTRTPFSHYQYVLMQMDSPPHEEEENGPHPEVIREMPFVMLGNVTSMFV